MRRCKLFAFAILVFSVFTLFAASVRRAPAQQPEVKATTERGIQAYKKGQTTEAITILREVVERTPEDADAWYHLGLSLFKDGLIGETREPFEHTVQLRPNSADALAKLSYTLALSNESEKAIAVARRAIALGDKSAHAHYAIAESSLRGDRNPILNAQLELAVQEADLTLSIDPNFSLALITKSFAQYNLGQYDQAAASLQQFLDLNSNDPDAEIWRERLSSITSVAGQSAATASSEKVFSGKDVDQRVHVLSKPEPQYSDEARRNGVIGTIVLRTVFSADGVVKNIRVMQALPYGLTTRAVRAARQIRFTPAEKDGKPVSMYIQLEYNFNLY
jgi:TonB family protein